MISGRKEPPEPDLVLEKIRHYCSYQERCIRDVEGKLREWAVQKRLIPGIVTDLIRADFLNEKRYASAFVRGKFRSNKWGKVKIEFELRIRGIPQPFITDALGEIDEDEYQNVLRDLILRKEKETDKEKDLNFREKILNFAHGKGYEMEKILSIMNHLKI